MISSTEGREKLRIVSKSRYVSCQVITEGQIGLIRKLFYDLGKYEQSKRAYTDMNHWEAASLIKTLKSMVNKRKSQRKKHKKSTVSKSK